MTQMKEFLDIQEKTVIKIFTNRIENLELKIKSMQEENKQLKGEVKALLESIEFQVETYNNMKKDMRQKRNKNQKLITGKTKKSPKK